MAEKISTPLCREVVDRMKERDYFRVVIADGLRDSYSILTEWSPDTTTELAENLVECLEDGCPLEGFDW